MPSAMAIWIGTTMTASSSVLVRAGQNFQSEAMARKWSSVNAPLAVSAWMATWMNGRMKNRNRNIAAGARRR
jgi:hypothetical protein